MIFDKSIILSNSRKSNILSKLKKLKKLKKDWEQVIISILKFIDSVFIENVKQVENFFKIRTNVQLSNIS